MADDSEIIKFFTNKSVFLTGGTGFLGKLTLERLLRVCRVKCIYMLVRPKKGKTEEERFSEIFGLEIFQRLRDECPDFTQHIKLIAGDCAARNLAISESDWNLLYDEVEVVIHCAATVRFDQDFRTAYYINIRSVKDLMTNARKMRKLQSFIHVSTAFSNCQQKVIEEKVYKPPMTAEQMDTFMSTFPDDEFISRIEKSILGDIPNTYTYTKCVAEELVQRLATDAECPLPVAIVRPSMILSTYKEPIPGWVDNVYGPLGVTFSVGVGLMRTLHCAPDNKADMVPVDYVVNSLLAVAYETANRGRDLQKSQQIQNVQNEIEKNDEFNFDVYNYTSWNHSIDWKTYMDLNHREGDIIVPIIIMWKPMIYLNKHLWLHNICWFLIHTIPAYIADGVLLALGKKPLLIEGYKKLDKFAQVISFFSVREWKMPHRKILNLYDKLNGADKQMFELRMSTFDWPKFAKDYMIGGRVYLLKEPLTNLEAARKRYRWILAAYYGLYAIAIMIACFLLNWFMSQFGLNLF